MPGEGRRNREKGDRREHEVQRGLELLGFYVTRAGGSLGKVDLVASRRDMEMYVQVKSNAWTGKLEADEIAEMDVLRDPKVYRVIARIDDGDSRVKVRVTRYGEAWYHDEAIASILSQALNAARRERAARDKVRKEMRRG